MSIGVCQTSVGLSAAVWSFLVEFDCWFGDILMDSPARKSVRLTSPASHAPESHQKVTGHSRAKKLAFWIGQVQWSPTGVWPEKGGECKDLTTKLLQVAFMRSVCVTEFVLDHQLSESCSEA